ncbi:MAG: DNA-protecting protein DprA [Nitrospirae bacterium]|nr:DNA-protecting protein DprA [Candidatus Troglogloeales bacterium]
MEQALYWLALKQVLGVGPVLYKRLIEHFKTPEAVFSADEEALWAVEGISESVAKNILTFKGFDSAKREMEKIDKDGVTLLTFNDPDYPSLLLTIYDPPPMLYRKGLAGGVTTNSDPYPIAMVGTRNMTYYGKSVASLLAGELVRVGITIVSGFARGIDATAHRAAMATGGRTFAVLGSGIDVIYPKEHKKLYDEIIENGFIFSEFPMGTHPEPRYFPQRNRVISGLSLGCVVCEASTKSGSLITARFAMEQGREVFAIPGSIFSETSKGVHSLIASGAKLVADVQDILKELLPQLKVATVSQGTLPTQGAIFSPRPTGAVLPQATVALIGDEAKLYNLLSLEPKQINTIIEASSLAPSVVSYCLLELELKGIVRQLGGQFFIRA